ncbi:hypothetical protein [Shewanella sp. YLB-07]|uniref:hypothetical protein n=1 Tax=Shewanella sp. YLB-07 TaxID=2601268 RepID=UPI00128DD0AE|nr:hypothetical protein [Shewanella sp. YLB-07]MPY24573.1 hypothetical protein [Shewanella sp. YLB-07]
MVTLLMMSLLGCSGVSPLRGRYGIMKWTGRHCTRSESRQPNIMPTRVWARSMQRDITGHYSGQFSG